MEYNEKDAILSHRRQDPYSQTRGPCGLNLRAHKNILAAVGVVCVVAAICVYAAVSVTSSTQEINILRQSAPGEDANNTVADEGNVPAVVPEVVPNPSLVNETLPEETEVTTQPPPSSSTGRGGIFDLFRRRNSAPTVRTNFGRLKGFNLTSRGGREYFGFYNVPYAEPPLGDLRFMPPQPAQSWNGTRDATVKGTMCVQRSRYNPDVDVEGTEDCLHSNIFTPKISRLFSRVSYPVIVYFFGGGFMHGTANDFNVDYFMDEDVVMVIVESRVGALGYLNTGDLTVTGNMGLKDQVEALKWVKDNIADFGGDPARVVAFGSSSGAMCAHAHLLSPMSAGLMSGVIAFSGTMLIPGGAGFDLNPRDRAVELGQNLNCTDLDDSELLVACLRNASAHEIALYQPDFSPSLETLPDGNVSAAFFPDSPINLMMQGKVNAVPWLVGVNSAEAILQSYTLLLNPGAVTEINNNFDSVAANLLGLEDWQNEVDKDEVLDIVEQVKDFYFENQTISKDSGTRYNLTNMISDRYFYHPTKVSGLQHAQSSSVYWYYLTKEANVSFADSVLPSFEPPYGVSHADEVQYVFSRPRYPYIPLDSEWFEFSQMFVKFLVSFADTGAPVNPDANGVAWPAVDAAGNGSVWYNLDDVPKLIEPFDDRLALWDSFPFQMLYNSSAVVYEMDDMELAEDDVLTADEEQALLQ